jgi:hypothetical protein
MRETWSFLNTPSGGNIMILAAIAWITGLAFGAELKHWSLALVGYTPKPKPKPFNERLADAEQKITTLKQLTPEIDGIKEALSKSLHLQNQLAIQSGTLNDNFAERILQLERDRTKAIEERYTLGARITSDTAAITQRLKDFDSLFYGINSRLDEHRLWGSNLEESINASKNSYAAALEEIPNFSLFMIEITHLISQVDSAIGVLLHIKKYLPGSDTARAPFSKRWCDAELSPKPDTLAIEWMLSVEEYLRACLDFSNTFAVAQSVVLEKSLGLLGSTWNQTMSMEDCESVLQNQRNKLTTARTDYAARLSALVAKAVIS